jgi:hypothetical protein
MATDKMCKLLDTIEANIDAETDHCAPSRNLTANWGASYATQPYRRSSGTASAAARTCSTSSGAACLSCERPRWCRRWTRGSRTCGPGRTVGPLGCLPHHTKTAQTRRPRSVIVSAAPDGPATYCAVQQLHTYFMGTMPRMRGCFTIAHAQPSGPPLLWPRVSRNCWHNTTLTMVQRATQCMGTMQQAYASGAPVLEIMQLGTLEVGARYLDVGRRSYRSSAPSRPPGTSAV